jgi:hypothetical protein
MARKLHIDALANQAINHGYALTEYRKTIANYRTAMKAVAAPEAAWRNDKAEYYKNVIDATIVVAEEALAADPEYSQNASCCKDGCNV